MTTYVLCCYTGPAMVVRVSYIYAIKMPIYARCSQKLREISEPGTGAALHPLHHWICDQSKGVFKGGGSNPPPEIFRFFFEK